MVLQKLRWYHAAPSTLEPWWRFLTDNERRNWSVLGQSRTSWENGKCGKNSTWFERWQALSGAQRAAAAALGWNEKLWDGFEWLLPTDAHWWQLSEDTQRHLAVLNESVDSWEEMFFSKNPAGFANGGDMREWAELFDNERRAAAELGFTP
jgi:hypothetical protein